MQVCSIRIIRIQTLDGVAPLGFQIMFTRHIYRTPEIYVLDNVVMWTRYLLKHRTVSLMSGTGVE